MQQTPPPQGLCAKADGKILAVETQSGFALVKVGDTVIRGQPLASAERLDRKGRAVVQGAAGRITARVEKQYTADQPLTAEAALYTGRSAEETTLYLPGLHPHRRPGCAAGRGTANRVGAASAGAAGAARLPAPCDHVGKDNRAR